MKLHDLVRQAVLITLDENIGKRYFNHAIQFSTFSNKMYCLYFRNNNIYDEYQMIIPTLFKNDDINKFELLMLNKNIDRVAKECLYIIHCEKQWHVEGLLT
jgi:hypothetical protein